MRQLHRLAALLAASLTLGYAHAAPPPKPLNQTAHAMTVAVVSYDIHGTEVANNGPPCNATMFGAPCLKILQAEEDTYTITFDYNTTNAALVDSVSSVIVYLCYSPWSQIGRPWRATSAAKDILTDKACYPKFAHKKVPPTANTPRTFPITGEWPGSTVFVRTVGIAQNGTAMTYGRSPGYFQVRKIDSRNKLVKGCAAGVIVGGLAVVGVSVFLDKALTKSGKRL